MASLLSIAARNLLKAKRRTFLLGLAVAIVAALFFVLRSVSASVGERMVESATTLSSGHVNVGGFTKVRKRGADAALSDRDGLKAFVREKVPEAESVIDRNRGWGRIVSPASSLNAGLSGIEPAQETRFFDSLRLAAEKEYKKDGGDAVKGDFAGLGEPNTVLLFAGQAKKLEVDVGDTVTVVIEGNAGQSNTVDLRVAAIASDIGFMSNFGVFVPRQTLLDLYGFTPTSTGVVMIYLKDPGAAQEVMERLRDDFRAAKRTVLEHDPKPFFVKFDKVMGEDWLGERLDLTVWSDEVSFVLWITSALDSVSFLVVGVLGLIIAGGITNAMWMSVRERTKEIGTMRAIGAGRGFIVGLFVVEAGLLGLVASFVGAVVALLGLLVINGFDLPIANSGVRLFLMTNTLRVSVHPTQTLATAILFAAVTCLAALWPAWRASRMRPVEALALGK